MPSHITHILLAQDIYNEGNLTEINQEYFITFSLGADLSKYSKVRKLSHKVKQDELILNMCDYLKKKQLTSDKELIATIYGHIAHMIIDNTIHPLIYQETRECKNKKLKNHTLIEGYYDSYLLKEKLGINIQDIKLKKYLQGRVTKVSKMLDYAYYKTYGYQHISKYYRLMLFLYRHYDWLYQILGIKFLKKFSGYQQFEKDNFNSLNSKEFMKLYNKSIKEVLISFKKIKLN